MTRNGSSSHSLESVTTLRVGMASLKMSWRMFRPCFRTSREFTAHTLKSWGHSWMTWKMPPRASLKNSWWACNSNSSLRTNSYSARCKTVTSSSASWRVSLKRSASQITRHRGNYKRRRPNEMNCSVLSSNRSLRWRNLNVWLLIRTRRPKSKSADRHRGMRGK